MLLKHQTANIFLIFLTWLLAWGPWWFPLLQHHPAGQPFASVMCLIFLLLILSVYSLLVPLFSSLSASSPVSLIYHISLVFTNILKNESAELLFSFA